MQVSTFSQIDWPNVLKELEGYARTEPGKRRLSSLLEPDQWAPSVESAHLSQKRTYEGLQLLSKEGLWSGMSGLVDLESSFEILKKNGTLFGEDLHEIRRWLRVMEIWGDFPEVGYPEWKNTQSQLLNPRYLLREIDAVLDDKGEVFEDATTDLRKICIEIYQIRKKIEQTLSGLLSIWDEKGWLQGRYFDYVNDHYLLPVKASYQSFVSGKVIDASVSQQTVYIEPQEIADLSTELSQKIQDKKNEIYRILTQTSEAVSKDLDELVISYDLLSLWDEVHAKARFAVKVQGKPVWIKSNSTFNLKKIAHPLLWKTMNSSEIVRNDIDFEEQSKVLLITGPNTGGKSVLLKTIGLSVIASRTGIFMPGDQEHQVPWIKNIFVDLGDDQSIESHLSSFSGHVVRYKKMLENLEENTLILFDELNSATDPEEGAALSRALLETLIERKGDHGLKIVVTTHDPHLKALALHDSRILNASVQFNEETSEPTYKIAIGIPGRSRAIEIAERIGLDQEVIQKAKKYLSSEHHVFQNLVSHLEKGNQTLEQKKKEVEQRLKEIKKKQEDFEIKAKKFVEETMSSLKQKLKKTLVQAQDEIENSRNSFRQSKKSRIDVKGEISQIQKKFTDQVEGELKISLPNEIQYSIDSHVEEKKHNFEIGDQVRVPAWGTLGTIIGIEKNSYKVTMGTSLHGTRSSMAVTLKRSQIQFLEKSEQKKQPSKIKIESQDEDLDVRTQIDLRGKRFEEAMRELEIYLDHSYRSHYSEVLIIHGLGTGAIKNGTIELLKKTPFVSHYEKAGTDVSGEGATCAYFER